ncbi:MAG: hypothetical protein H8D56_07280 [Planctomycetes bacterium]|nr:hypothetical protein [Planctomycetota bacterium]MBL7145462.1 hypothetical protein [Phycisphaerae bacterium]
MKKNILYPISILIIFSAYVCAEEIKPGEYKTFELGPGENRTLFFQALKNDVVSILMGDINDTSYWGDFLIPEVQLVEPNGTFDPNHGNHSAAIEKIISESGTYMIIASEWHGNRTGRYGLSMIKNPGTDVNDPEDSPVPILNNDYKEGYIAEGDMDGYRGYFNKGDVVFVRMGDVNDTSYWGDAFIPEIQLVEPNGVFHANHGNHSAAIEKIISESGPHMIIAREYRGNRACRYGLSMSLLRRAVGTPTISSLSDEPDPVFQGGKLTLTALDVNDPDGSIVQVNFYRDLNGDGYLDRDGPDQLLGSDTNGLDGWSWSDSIGRLPPVGLNMYFAIAKDNNGLWSDPASTAGEIVAPIPGDINLDGEVNCEDIEILIENLGISGCGEPSWCSGADLDQNGVVDSDDLQIIVDNWTQTSE